MSNRAHIRLLNSKDMRNARKKMVKQGRRLGLDTDIQNKNEKVKRIDQKEESDGENSNDDIEEVDCITVSVDSCHEFMDDSNLKRPRRLAIQSPKEEEKPKHESTDGKLTIEPTFVSCCCKHENLLDEDEPVVGNIVPKKEEPDDTSKEVEIQHQACKEEILEVMVDMESSVVERTGTWEMINESVNSELTDERGSIQTPNIKKPKRWSNQDTRKFYQLLRTVGPDFSLLATFFPGRTRACLKGKFKREEKSHGRSISEALSCERTFDLGSLKEKLSLKKDLSRPKQNPKAQQPSKKLKTNEDCKKERNRKSVTGPRQSYFGRIIKSFQR